MNAHARQPIDTSVTGSLAEATRKVPVLLLAAIFAWPAATLAQGSNAASRFQQYESQQAFVPAVVPLGVKGGGRVKVVVVLAADSVAAARARVPERALTSDERRLVISDYFLNEDAAGKVHAEGDHLIHVVKVTNRNLVLDRRFHLDFNTAFSTGPARPHGLAFK